ncbi:MAG TPA: family 16 glycoside hydrolase, partial [Verrucomicrobiae bacterium]|nr:family 16 glycoside hydrolase [Verrucomicrobiae bacterium]
MVRISLAFTLAALALQAQPRIAPIQETGFQPIFDGRSLDGWDGDPGFWRVEDGALVGQTTTEKQPKQNTFLIWRGG